MCRYPLGVSLLLVPARSQASTEAELISLYLAGPAASSSRAALAAAARAAGTGPAVLPSPELAARQEVARGDAGATTEAIGGAVSVDLGFSSLAGRGAAQLRGAAAEPQRQAALLSAVCAVREEALSLWVADAVVESHEQVLSRVSALRVAADALAEAGERSGYDRDRLALVAQTHRTAASAAAGEAAAQRARLSALVGASIERVSLAPLPPLPSLSSVRGEVQGHPQLAALRLERDAVSREVSAARRAAVPDLTVSGGLRWDTPPQGGASSRGYEVGAALELPVFANGRAEIRGAEAALSLAEAQLAQQTAALTSAAEGAWHRASAEQAEVIVPESLWEAARIRYLGGEADLDEVLQLLQALDEAQHAATVQQHRARQAQLALSCAVGRFRAPEVQSVFEGYLP